MNGETNLDKLLKNMQAELHQEIFVFCTLEKELSVEMLRSSIAFFKEKEGVTYILPQLKAETLGIDYTYKSRMITLNIHSNLDAVGFLAAITTKLAQSGISVNPVSAFYHDHLFVPEEKAGLAMDLLSSFSD